MEQAIRGGKLLTLVIARDKRADLVEIEQQVRRLADVVDRFYELLGPRNWIFHDSMNLDRVEEIVTQTDEAESAEQRLIELYRDEESSGFWLRRLRSVDGLRERLHQVQRARAHYDADQFDSCVLHLIAVMDGFVNDFEPQARKGLAAREPDDMVAWDSVVGHHLGLTNTLGTYNRTIKKRVDDEVYELYRHGIVHGSIVSFDNIVVATKAWNMLFALVDWSKAKVQKATPPPRSPSLRDAFRSIRERQRVKELIDVWQATSLSQVDEQFASHEIFNCTVNFLSAWRHRNFGALARFASWRIAKGEQGGRIAGEMRESFTPFILTDFEVTELENSAPPIWFARGTAVVNGDRGNFECRWLIEKEDGTGGFGSPSAQWRLGFCDPTVWRRDWG